MKDKQDALLKRTDLPEQSSSSQDIQAFLKAARSIGAPKTAGENGRLVFALDATMSRQPTWDQACHLQAEMFHEAGKVGGLDVQLVYFRGFGECRASKWARDATQLASMMGRIHCQGGRTQIRKVLKHTIAETRKKKVQALIYIGDCMEEEPDLLCDHAGELGLLGVPTFMFQEGNDPLAEHTFKEVARLTKGVFHRFDRQSAERLRQLLGAVAAYSAGGRVALENLSNSGHKGAQLLIGDMR
ncbi:MULTISPECIES: VWA domain-containing protein [Pseudovibrio]|uniref:VWA domain-containing protein n=1 Tax=Stappiaceae TaxID=2821832 RepID=UPI002365EED0|nr:MULTISPECIES: VWA domain-containing protein [Pseudovibrio]MDD7910673.1 VWA domain-containing protein [Pseudovibrio exalbescens]MDX5594488.1 VWA domain-containing protein [Pseudovibrio sp. SPO723]